MTFYDRLIRALLLRRRHSSGLRTEESRRAFLRTMVLGGATLPFVPGALERITLSNCTPYGRNGELIRLMGSGDYITAQAAREAFAAFITPTILQVIDQAPIMSEFFTAETYCHDWTLTRIGEAPAFSLDLTSEMPSLDNRPHSEIVLDISQ